MTGAQVWALVGIGIVFLGVALGSATLQWSRWRKHRTSAEKRQTERDARDAFQSEGPD